MYRMLHVLWTLFFTREFKTVFTTSVERWIGLSFIDLVIYNGSPLVDEDGAIYEDYIVYVPDRAHNDERYAICGAKLVSLGWNEEVEWREGLEATVKWYRDHRDHWGSDAGRHFHSPGKL